MNAPGEGTREMWGEREREREEGDRGGGAWMRW